MRILSVTLAALATSAFALAPASACEWMKSANKDQMTVATTLQTPDIDQDVSIATNDLSLDVTQDMDRLPVQDDTAAE